MATMTLPKGTLFWLSNEPFKLLEDTIVDCSNSAIKKGIDTIMEDVRRGYVDISWDNEK